MCIRDSAWRIELADDSFKMVWIMACLSLARRSKAGKFIQAKEEDIQNYNEYSFSESIYQRIEKEYKPHTSEDDVMFLALMLLTAKKLKNFTDLKGGDYARAVSYTHLDVYKRQPEGQQRTLRHGCKHHGYRSYGIRASAGHRGKGQLLFLKKLCIPQRGHSCHQGYPCYRDNPVRT